MTPVTEQSGHYGLPGGGAIYHALRYARCLRPCTPEHLVDGPIRLGPSVLFEYRIQ